MNDKQFSSRKRWSTIDTAVIMMDIMNKGWSNGNIMGILLVDIKVAIPSVAMWRLVNAMKGKHIDGDLI